MCGLLESCEGTGRVSGSYEGKKRVCEVVEVGGKEDGLRGNRRRRRFTGRWGKNLQRINFIEIREQSRLQQGNECYVSIVRCKGLFVTRKSHLN